VADGSKLVERGICRDAPHPCAKASGRIEPGAPAVCAPECLDHDIVCCTRVTDDAHDPAVDLGFVEPEQLFECRLLALDEPAEDLGVWDGRHVGYLALLGRSWKGSCSSRILRVVGQLTCLAFFGPPEA
jgi:hypothetical protein